MKSLKSLKSLGKMNLLIFCFILIGTTYSRKFNEINLIRSYIGCFRNFVVSHRCSSGHYDIRSCLGCCHSSTFAGLKNGSSCYCGENFERSSDESNCQMKCPYSELRNCGGKLDYSVFSVCEIGYHGNECNQPCNGCSTSVLCSRNNGRCLYDCHDNENDCDISRLLTDVNIAFKRPVSQSSTHKSDEGTLYPPELAVDGSFDNTFENKYKAYCSQTSKDDLPWFRVDLGQPTPIRSIVITNRAGVHGSRLAGVTIYLLNELPTDIIDNKDIFYALGKYCNKMENIADHDITVEMNCLEEIKGRYLFAVLPGKQHLTICEIEVFAKNCDVSNNCKTNEQCQQINFDGNFYHRCICRKGFSRQNLVTECQDVDECSEEVFPCGDNSNCTNNIGSYSCQCHVGFEGNPFEGCEDIDECSRHDSPCGDNANCTNNIGSYMCTCHVGFKEDPGKGCVDIDECAERNNSCGNNEICTNTIGGFKCRCNRGYQNDTGSGCLDVDECKETRDYPCGNNTNCLNLDGSYECQCKDGFYGDPKQECVDKDECKDGSIRCGENSNCSNNIGSYQCHCNEGYTGDPYQDCVDLDECSAENYRCGNNTNCMNKIGSFECQCKDGYHDDPIQGCVAISNPVVAILTTMAVLLALVLLAFLVYFYISRIRKSVKTVDSEKIILSENANNKEEREDTKIQIENLASYMMDVMTKSSSGFAEQFEKIPKIANYSMSVSKASGKGKNRFTNIVPYDYNRVILKNSDKGDYINASHIETGKQKFIAAQGPTIETVGQFWQMIVEQDVSDIVMLTQIMEKSKNKCFQYWPDECVTKFGKYTVTLESSADFEDYIRRELKVSLTDTGKDSKTVTQWHYMCWPDHGVPKNVDSFLKFNKVSMRNTDKYKSVIVHCSAGVGRTGCFIAIDLLMDEAERQGTIDVVACVSMLREQRSNMVQSAIQYDFIYYALKCTTTKSNTDIPLDMLHSTFMVLSEGNDLSDEFQSLKEEVGFLEKRGKSKFKSNQWWISAFMGVTASNHHHISCYPEENATSDFWNFCFQSKCLVVLVDNLKTWEHHKFLPTADDRVITDKFYVILRDQQALKFGTLLEICILSKPDEEENFYENKVSTGREILLKVLKLRSDYDSHIGGELFQQAKQKLDLLNRNSHFDNLFVLSPNKSPLASYFVACCDLTEQLTCRKYVDVYKTVLELKRTPMGDTITLDQYKMLYRFIENQVQMLTNVYINQ